MLNPKRGEDITLEITLKYEDGTAVNLSTLTGYKVSVFQEGKIVQKFSQNASTGYTLTNETDATNGVFQCIIERENTVNLKCGEPIYYSVKIEYTDANNANGVSTRDTGNVQFGILEESKQRDTNTF